MNYRARLSFTVTLELDTNAKTPAEAFEIAQNLETKMLASEWQAKNALNIEAVKETQYYSKIDIAEIRPMAQLG